MRAKKKCVKFTKIPLSTRSLYGIVVCVSSLSDDILPMSVFYEVSRGILMPVIIESVQFILLLLKD